MDPNANLAEQRRIQAKPELSPADWRRLAELAQALDEWIAGGGFLPAAWTEKPPTPRSMGRSMIPAPMPREEFDALIERRRSRQHDVRELDISLTVARARGVVPVTVETLNTNQTMGLGREARRSGRANLSAAVDAWHERQDTTARDVIIAHLNAEARPQ